MPADFLQENNTENESETYQDFVEYLKPLSLPNLISLRTSLEQQIKGLGEDFVKKNFDQAVGARHNVAYRKYEYVSDEINKRTGQRRKGIL